MNSILNNSAALSALQALSMTQQALNTTQNQVSTGLSVSSAADNAAYWSIGQQLTADSGIATAANTALSQSQAIFDTANSAINSVITTITAIQTALTQANNPGANLSNINTTLSSLSSQLTDAVNGASFNGTNLLNNSASANFVAGYDSAQGTVTQIGFQNQSLVALGDNPTNSGATTFSSTTTTQTLGSITDATQIADIFNITATGSVPGAPTAGQGGSGATGGLNQGTGSVSVFSSDANGNLTTTTYTAYDANGIALTGTSVTAAQIASLSVTQTTQNASGAAAGLLVQMSSSASAAATAATAGGTYYDLTKLGSGTGATAVTATNDSDMLSAVTAALGAVTNYAASIGATQDRMTAASNFNSAVTTDYSNGISALVDADMNTASTRLQALQTQQQLGIQSLSIANQNAQLILKLFPG